MKKRIGIWALAGALLYGALIFALLWAEKAVPGSGIRSVGDALWYSLVTLTTVGYGDLYPLSPLGRVIGLVFLLLSVGVLGAVLGAAASLLRGRLLPFLRLEALRGKRCFLFSEINEASLALAQDLLQKEPSCRVLFCRGERTAAPPSRRVFCFSQDAASLALLLRGRGEKTVFLMSEKSEENLAAAEALKDRAVEVYCRGEEGGAASRARFFDAASCAARAYWRAHPLKEKEKTIVLAGDGPLAREMLSRAVLVNCRVPFQATAYHVFGDWAEYRGDHPVLEEAFAPAAGDENRDTIQFHSNGWNADPALLAAADRVIFCGDDPGENARAAARLLRSFAISGSVHAAARAVAAPAVAFGDAREIYTQESVLQSAQDALAREIHALYCRRYGQDAPWESLSPFMKDSNRAQADHLPTKMRLLLGKEIPQITPEICKEAANAWRALPDREPCRRNEHARWMRFYQLYNWRWGEEKNPERRTHPCLTPYEALSREDKEKDDGAWLLLGLLGGEEEKA